MTYAAPSIVGGGIVVGGFVVGGPVTSGDPVLYVAIAGELIGEAREASFGLGRADWFDVLSPQPGSVTVIGEHDPDPNGKVVLSTAAGVRWVGYVDRATTTDDLETGSPITTVTMTDVIGRLGRTVRPPGRVTTGGGTLIARFFPLSSGSGYGDLVDVLTGYLAEYAPDLSIDVAEGPSTGTLPALIDWYDPPSGTTLLQIINQAEASSNAIVSLLSDGSLLVTMRATYPDPTAPMVDLSGQHRQRTVSRGRDTLVNRWTLTRPSYDDTTVLDASETSSIALYGERVLSITDYLCSTAAHFGAPFRAAMSQPRRLSSRTFPIADLSAPALELEPGDWVITDGDVWQVLGVKHDVSLDGWTVTVDLDVSQNGLNGTADPTPA